MHKFGFELYKSYIYYKTITVMNIEEIKRNTFEVDILNTGREGDRLCYLVYNDKLGKFLINTCDCTGAPLFCTDSSHHLFGNASIVTSDGLTHDLSMVLNINKDNPRKGSVVIRF